MKSNSDPRAMVGQRRLEQIQKQAAGIQGVPGEDKDRAHTILILEEARKWLAQFYSETAGMSTDSSNALNSRWSEVRKQIWDGELDYLSREELEYGAKVAWRNSTRCVGRLVWASLVVRDLRHLNTPKHVFDALVDHIVLSTNRGRIVPMVSVFASGSVEKPKVRIWNRQLIGYAGYMQADGSVLGDPINLGFTQRIEALGWKAPSQGRFNLLPIVIEMEGAVDWFDLPAGVVLEVPIRHPQYNWFEQLGFKWFALPAVSGMRLEIGGVSFSAAPFSDSLTDPCRREGASILPGFRRCSRSK